MDNDIDTEMVVVTKKSGSNDTKDIADELLPMMKDIFDTPGGPQPIITPGSPSAVIDGNNLTIKDGNMISKKESEHVLVTPGGPTDTPPPAPSPPLQISGDGPIASDYDI